MTQDPLLPLDVPGVPDRPWERLSPLSPVLRGGVAVVGVLGWIFAQLFQQVFASFSGGTGGTVGSGARGSGDRADPSGDLDRVVAHPFLSIGGLAFFLCVVVGGAWLSWRFTRFRIDAAHVELRKGWLFRQQRQVPMDRVQAVEVRRPLLAQLLGLGEVVVQSAGGADSHLRLAFLSLARATAVREDIQRAAARSDESLPNGEAASVGGAVGIPSATATPTATATGASQPGPTPTVHGGVGTRVSGGAYGAPGERFGRLPGDLLGLGPEGGRPVLSVPNLRLFAATMLHSSVFVLLGLAGLYAIVFGLASTSPLALAVGIGASLPAMVPAAIGLGIGRVRELLKHGNFRITDQGRALRVTHGLTDHRTTTIPLHRVQALEMRQSIWWRPLGWWRAQVNVAGVHMDRDRLTNETVVLPVGTLDQTLAVLTLLDPALAEADVRAAALGGGGEAGWVTSPRSARFIDPLAWRRRGYAVTEHGVFIRTGVLDRRVVIVPHARIQSLTIRQGLIQRLAGVASVHVISTMGPITPKIEHLTVGAAERFLMMESRRSAGARRVSPSG